MNDCGDTNSGRKSTVDYWDENWRRASDGALSPLLNERDSYYWRRLDRALAEAFEGLRTEGATLMEVGAGSSEWLPYLHHRFGFRVAGLDYSSVGCTRARENLSRTETAGEIHEGDMFSPPEHLRAAFDVVVSFGLVEHFADTAGAVRACASYARPGGLVVTVIPNMSGLYGHLYRVFDRKVFDIHVPLTLKDLSVAHQKAGLVVLRGEHILGVPGVVDRQRVEPVLIRRLAREFVYHLSKALWAIEERGWGLRENAITSPYMIVVARKMGADSEGNCRV